MSDEGPGSPVGEATSGGSAWTDLGRPPLRVAALRRALLQDPDAGWTSLDVVASTGSTNADLAAAAAAGTARSGAVLVAEHQVAGRGRRDRVWTAPPRSSLSVSVLLVPEQVPQAGWSWLPLLVGTAAAAALARVGEVPTGLKWPNDVLARVGSAGGPSPASGLGPEPWHKVGGILAEVVTLPADGRASGPVRGVVAGIGLNVGQRADELPDAAPGGFPAGSLTTLGAATTDRDTVLRAVLRAIDGRYRRWVGGDTAALARDYREMCLTVGQDVQVHLPGERTLAGRAVGVDDDGRLAVAPRGGGQVVSLAAGDVVHVRSA